MYFKNRQGLCVIHATVMFLFLLITILTHQASSQESCPEDCECNKERMDCRNSGLTAFSKETVGDEIEKVYLCQNRLTSIPFVNATNLELLILDDNRLRSAHFPGEYHILHNLKKIVLSSNEIATIKKDDFSHLKNIRIKNLHLSKCNIKNIEAESFDNLVDLETLILSQNSIETLPTLIFEKLENLKNLNLKENKLSIIPIAENLSNQPLILHIASNRINCLDKNNAWIKKNYKDGKLTIQDRRAVQCYDFDKQKFVTWLQGKSEL